MPKDNRVEVSIVTITRDNRVGLESTLRSVDEQKAIEIEHVVIDACSKDGSITLLQEFASRTGRIVWRSAPDAGRYDGMNKGLALSTKPLVWFLHAGDTFANCDAARTICERILDSHADWGYGLARVSRNGDVIELRGEVPFQKARFMLGQKSIPHQAVVMKTSFLRAIGGYSLTTGIAEDQNMLMRAVLHTPPLVVPEIACDFDGSGIGSHRKIIEHYADFRRFRKINGAIATITSGTDFIVGAMLCFREYVNRFLHRNFS
ncbi:glycosyl transferase family 2 [Pseudonocardia sediminis]|uniref:4,4'-diaponeurosporenoate glycosyltransferase n=1 Tax=Pseudonocardia sediminis TaxID=1397368 RepID=A0A4Q7V5H0_PSEST|nr:glycosyltransferase [Pseudonocardia sediminis]RZT87909.1 glycosyl transferase family 2 [Pseudonocardia sediminis]